MHQRHLRETRNAPGFGCTISDAVQASCSAYPFFALKIVTTAAGDEFVIGMARRGAELHRGRPGRGSERTVVT
jgi:hypothetical protein